LGLDVARDVVIPPSIGGFAQECLERRQHLAENPRHLLASFKGLIRSQWWHSKGIRQLWHEL